jgi:hypothetical protein
VAESQCCSDAGADDLLAEPAPASDQPCFAEW